MCKLFNLETFQLCKNAKITRNVNYKKCQLRLSVNYVTLKHSSLIQNCEKLKETLNTKYVTNFKCKQTT